MKPFTKALLYKATDFLGRKFCGLSSGSIASHAAIFGEKKIATITVFRFLNNQKPSQLFAKVTNTQII